MKQIVLSSCFALMAITGFAQAKTTTSATVAFDATTPLDALPKAENKTVVAMLNTISGEVGFEAAVNNFAFTNPTIQQHFNEERWLNSGKFPLFTFTGKITDLKNVNFKKDGTYTVNVEGTLTVKDKSNPVTTTATLAVKGGSIQSSSNFTFKLSDYGINVGSQGKIANEPKITVSADFK
jgi:polyisoprenoid-binding protein YceI